MDTKEIILSADTALGIEFGSTNIKAVLTDSQGKVIATGKYGWENRLENGIWTYTLSDIESGLQGCYSDIKNNIRSQYGVSLKKVGAIGVSAMMHGYLAFDKDMNLLHPFETWRNTDTEDAADELTNLFNFNIPLRWSVAHLYQRILDNEEHVKNIDKVFTLAAFVHYKLTGQFVIGTGDASGMFPQKDGDYDEELVDKFDKLMRNKGIQFKVRDIFPKVLLAGQSAGKLTKEGAKLIDPEGDLEAGILLCPPEGDAGTGMVATNAVRINTGNTSAGTSTFAMLVLEKPLSKLYRELDIVTTPTGYPVAMAHANNGTTDINKWMELFKQIIQINGNTVELSSLFEKLYINSLQGEKDCDGIVSYGYYSGEGITKLNEGRPLLVRPANSNMSAANFIRNLIYGSLASVKIGMDILLKDEGAKCISMTGHGGLFKIKGVAQKYLAAALNAPVTVMETASEGGPWGMALLAAYSISDKGKNLEDWLDDIFETVESETMNPDAEDVIGFEKYIDNYKNALTVEKKAVEAVKQS